jgi:hypothetical protein
VLSAGELGFETDTTKFKIGDGTTNWNGLNYLDYTDQRVDDRIAAADTDDISEGSTNLYYTDARVEAVITASDTDDLSEGSTNLYYTDARVLLVASPLNVVENVVTSNYTLVAGDAAKVVAVNSSSNLTVTVPTNVSVAFPVGTVLNVYRAGTGSVTIAGASGVTVRNSGAIAEQFGEVALRKRATNEWVLSGQVD